MPDPSPTPPTLTGWQYVLLECVKLLAPILALAFGGGALYYSGRSDAKSDQAEQRATKAEESVGAIRSEFRPWMRGQVPPKD